MREQTLTEHPDDRLPGPLAPLLGHAHGAVARGRAAARAARQRVRLLQGHPDPEGERS